MSVPCPSPFPAMHATELACLEPGATAPAIATSWAAKGLRSSFPRIGGDRVTGSVQSRKARQNAIADFDRELARKYSLRA